MSVTRVAVRTLFGFSIRIFDKILSRHAAVSEMHEVTLLFSLVGRSMGRRLDGQLYCRQRRQTLPGKPSGRDLIFQRPKDANLPARVLPQYPRNLLR